MDLAHAFVGRDAELAALDRALADARARRGRLVLLVGDGGIGKTRLIEEFAHRAALPAGRVVWARCPEQSGAPTYWPWTQLVRRYASVRPDDALRAELADAAEELARLVPSIAQRLGLPPAPADVAGDHARFHLFDGLGRFLARAASDAPLVLVLDDLHWADPASLDLLQYLATELRQSQLLLLGTLRPREMRRRAEAMDALARVGQRIALGGLDLGDVRRLVEPALPETDDDVIATLRDATGGNPFFLRELVAGLRDGGAADLDALHAHLPESLRAAIRGRLAPLDADRAVLDVAAVMGAEFDLPDLARACDLDVARTLEHLSNAQAADVVVEVGDVPGRFRFAHALLREAVYGDLLPAARMHAHRRVAHALEAGHGERSDAPHAALAHHYSRCAALGEAEAAIRWARSAAMQAAALGAWSEAAAHHAQALNAAMLLPPDEALRHELRIALGHASTRAGDDLGAREIFRRARDAARARGDAGGALVASIGHAAAIAQPAIPDSAGIAVLEEALQHPVDGHAAARAQAQAILSWKLYFTDQRDRARALAEAAVAAARALGERSALAVGLLALHYTRWDPDGVAERTAIADEVLALTRSGVAPTLAWEAVRLRVTDALDVGDVVGAGLLIDDYVRHVETSRAPRHLAIGDFLRGGYALLLGKLDEAERYRLRAVERRPPSPLNNTAPYATFQQLVLARARGATAALAEPLGAIAEQLPQMPLWRVALGVVAADQGRAADARHALAVVAADDFRTLRVDCNWLPTLALAAELATAVGDTARAAALYDRLAPWSRLWITFGLGAASLGPVEHYLGLLALALGRLDVAEGHLERALAAQAAGHVALPHVQTLRARARVAEARGDEALAAELQSTADRTAERLSLARPMPAPVATPAPRTPTSTPPSRPGRQASLRREGDYWTVVHDGQVARLKDTKGVHYLATLLAEPGREFHVLELAGGEAADPVPAQQAAEAGLPAGDLGDAGELLDPAARKAYQRRAAELRHELEEAESFNDVGRAERLRQELEFLADELARGVGLGGRDRKAAAAAERARQNVTRAILVVVRKIATDLPSLGEHLQASVKTGTFCSYAADGRLALAWDVG